MKGKIKKIETVEIGGSSSLCSNAKPALTQTFFLSFFSIFFSSNTEKAFTDWRRELKCGDPSRNFVLGREKEG